MDGPGCSPWHARCDEDWRAKSTKTRGDIDMIAIHRQIAWASCLLLGAMLGGRAEAAHEVLGLSHRLEQQVAHLGQHVRIHFRGAPEYPLLCQGVSRLAYHASAIHRAVHSGYGDQARRLAECMEDAVEDLADAVDDVDDDFVADRALDCAEDLLDEIEETLDALDSRLP